MLGRRYRSTILICAQKACIKRVARKIEIVRVAAKGRGSIFRCPGQPYVGVLAIGVELVLPSTEQRHHLTAGRLRVGAAGLLQLGDLRVARFGQRLSGLRSDRAYHIGRDVRDHGDHFGLLTRTFELGIAPVRDEPIEQIVGSFVRIVEQAARDTMVVGQDQSIGRYEAGRTATRQSHSRIAHRIEPRLIGSPAILLADLFGWKTVERPHAFFCHGRLRSQRTNGGGGKKCVSIDLHLTVPPGPQTGSRAVMRSVRWPLLAIC